MLEFVDVGLGYESGYDEVSYGVPYIVLSCNSWENIQTQIA
jgi:hypothetical protein